MDAAHQLFDVDLSVDQQSDWQSPFHVQSPAYIHAPVFLIEEEVTGDKRAREALLDRAMGLGRKRKSSEKLRRNRSPAEGLSLVAKNVSETGSGALIGTVRLWHIRLGANGPAALLLGPLAVEPAIKGGGIGSALMLTAIEKARRLGHAAIVLVGDPLYYQRFGFTSEKTGNLAMPGPFEKHRLLALELKESVLDNAAGIICAK